MSNKYFSRERRFWAHRIGVDTLAAGTDYAPVLAPNDLYLMNVNQPGLNPDSNIIVRSLGLFSNFADGLVWKSSLQSLWARITVKGWKFNPTTFSGTSFSTPGNTLQVTGDATTWLTEGLADGDYFTDGSYIYRADTVAETTIDVKDPIPLDTSAIPLALFRKLDFVNGYSVRRELEIRELCTMIPYDEFFTPALLGSGVEFLTFEASLNSNGEGLEFMTHSIDPAFDGSEISLDICMDMEYTAR